MIYWKWHTPEEPAQRAEQTGKEDVAPGMPLGKAALVYGTTVSRTPNTVKSAGLEVSTR